MVVGQQVTLTATVASVAPGSGNPSGNVTFYDYIPALNQTITLGTSTLSVVNGVDEANLNYTFTTPQGTHDISAGYAGDGNYVPTQAPLPTVPLNLTGDASSVSLTSSLPK